MGALHSRARHTACSLPTDISTSHPYDRMGGEEPKRLLGGILRVCPTVSGIDGEETVGSDSTRRESNRRGRRGDTLSRVWKERASGHGTGRVQTEYACVRTGRSESDCTGDLQYI
jgi:hypothetical protein